MVNVEEQYLAGIYTPDFLKHQDDEAGEITEQQEEDAPDNRDETSDENDPSFANRPAVKRGTKGDD